MAASDRGGATASYRPAGPSANAYKNKAISSMVVLRRKAGRSPIWQLDQVIRSEVWPRNSARFNVTLSDAGIANLTKRTLAAFGRKEWPAEMITKAA